MSAHLRRQKSEQLQESLLEIGTEWYAPKRKGCGLRCKDCLSAFFTKGNVCLMASFFIGLTGILVRVFAVPQNCDDDTLRPGNDTCSKAVIEIARYFIAFGLFGFAGGFTNWLAIMMIFYRIPLVYGSGIIPNQHRKISESVKAVITNTFFNETFLSTFTGQKISHWVTTHETGKRLETILQSPDVDRVLNAKLDQLYSDNAGEVLKAIGLEKEKLKPMVQPFLLGLSADITPALGRKLAGTKGSAVQWLKREVDNYMTSRAKELTKETVTDLLKQVIGKHLGWIVVWGTVLGGLIGILSQAVHISPQY